MQKQQGVCTNKAFSAEKASVALFGLCQAETCLVNTAKGLKLGWQYHDPNTKQYPNI